LGLLEPLHIELLKLSPGKILNWIGTKRHSLAIWEERIVWLERSLGLDDIPLTKSVFCSAQGRRSI
jgi:hypothetical protein